jgi:hypothetical protein
LTQFELRWKNTANGKQKRNSNVSSPVIFTMTTNTMANTSLTNTMNEAERQEEKCNCVIANMIAKQSQGCQTIENRKREEWDDLLLFGIYSGC